MRTLFIEKPNQYPVAKFYRKVGNNIRKIRHRAKLRLSEYPQK